ncbi:MAG: hypothetical protein K2N13_08975 [Paraprevotella sp.]|nr:hypothetical protein [Paraprevotella sp.]
MIANAEIQEIIVYAIVAATMLLALARIRRMWRGRGGCRDCATPCALKQEMEKKTGMFRAKCENKGKKIPRKGCSITKIS